MNTTNKDYFAEFKSELCDNIKKTIRSLKRNGTVAMSERNLLQVTPTPRNSRGPMGTNAQWAYSQIFTEVLNAIPSAKKFTYVA